MNAETGEVLDEAMDVGDVTEPQTPLAGGRTRRHSTRTHTVANTSATVNRVKDEVRKVSWLSSHSQGTFPAVSRVKIWKTSGKQKSYLSTFTM